MISYCCKKFADEHEVDSIQYAAIDEMLEFVHNASEEYQSKGNFDVIEITTFVDGEEKAKDYIEF